VLNQPRLVPTDTDIDRMAAVLKGASRVAILAGAGCAGAHAELLALADRLAAPIVHTLRGKEHVEWDNPFDVGMTGLIGFSSGYHAMENCDALLMLGTDFPYRNFYPEHAAVIQVDRDPGQLGKRVPLALGVAGDVRETVQALLPALPQRDDRSFLEAARTHYVKARAGLDDAARPSRDGRPVHPQYLARLVSDLAAPDAVFSADVGTPTVWSARYLGMNGRRRLLVSGNHGSMANALPQALGAQAAFPGRQVVSLSGDGGFAMSMGDLLSLKQNSLPVKIVLFNNGLLGFVAMEQKAGGFLDVNVNLDNPDFAAIANAAGVLGLRVEDSNGVEPALRQAFAHDGPALIDVRIAPQELAMPPAIQLQQAKGFSLFMLRAVLSGRGDEVLEIVRTNLL
jgi:pyruvate dehydrogenase (quinone)